MDKAQLFFFFASGFLASRLLIKVRAPQWLVFQLVGRRHLLPSRIILYVIVSAALLSVFIPNVLTVLTILPVVALLRMPLETEAPKHSGAIATYLALALIYGANIGGMGSVTATPANGILITYTVLNPQAGAAAFTFERWLVWGLPLVVLMTFVAWVVLVAAFRPNRHLESGAVLPFPEAETRHPHQHAAAGLTVLFFLSSILLSVWMQETARPRLVLAATGLFTIGYAGALFLLRWQTNDGMQRRPLMTVRDCYADLPLRGIAFVVGFLVVTGALALAGLPGLLAKGLTGLLPSDVSTGRLLLVLALITSFSTEILSNTVIQIAMFTIAGPLAHSLAVSTAPMLLVVTLSCTSAFMSPAATGVNSLAFGEIRGISIWRMLAVGAVMNLVGAFVLSAWVNWVVGGLLGWL